MKNQMDMYSKPIRTEQTKVGTLYYMDPRRNPSKPGRELLVTFDDRFPLVDGFESHYSYYVRFLKMENVAGNHYHSRKQELFVPLVGNFQVQLEDIVSKERETIALRTEEHVILHVKTRVAHKVTPSCKGAILLVHATSPNNEEDEFPYQIA